MHVLTTPRATALAVSSAMFIMQLVAFGSVASGPATAADCPDMSTPMSTPGAITVPPVAPETPAFSPIVGESSPVSI
ncbi:MAG: hypothetical protein AAFN78_17525 [Pseudomonadota bacterium]